MDLIKAIREVSRLSELVGVAAANSPTRVEEHTRRIATRDKLQREVEDKIEDLLETRSGINCY